MFIYMCVLHVYISGPRILVPLSGQLMIVVGAHAVWGSRIRPWVTNTTATTATTITMIINTDNNIINTKHCLTHTKRWPEFRISEICSRRGRAGAHDYYYYYYYYYHYYYYYYYYYHYYYYYYYCASQHRIGATSAHSSAYMRVCVCVYIYIYIYIHRYVYIYIYMYIHMYMYIYIYIYTYNMCV